ncbi:hypothetical protein TYRP_015782, partial [Tyrophagus putrescentiae]
VTTAKVVTSNAVRQNAYASKGHTDLGLCHEFQKIVSKKMKSQDLKNLVYCLIDVLKKKVGVMVKTS